MRVFLAGAAGVIGRRLAPLLLAAGHEVIGTTRSAARASELEQLSVQAAVVDVFDAGALRAAVLAARPDAVIHQLTALPQRLDTRRPERTFAANDRIRTEGTRNLLAAAAAAGVGRVIAQSIAFVYAPGPPGTIHGEDDELVPAAASATAGAVAELERMVSEAAGVVLRYGFFYGPGSGISREGAFGQDVRRRRLPVVGRGEGVWPLIHVDDAAAATVAALAHEGPAVFNVIDDHPAPVAEWLPGFAAALGAPRPLRVPAFAARLIGGEYAVQTMTALQGASNARARRELGWAPRYTSWREGFAAL